ncbi:MAG: HAD family hydrolase [Clostridia bacterium]|nr:HAD family hydrolase [Clostridia bacterium]
MKGFVFDLDNTLFDRYATLSAIIIENFETIRPYINPVYTAAEAAEHFCRTESLYLHLGQGWNSLYQILVQERFFHPNNIPTAEFFIGFIMQGYLKIGINFPFIFDLLEEIKSKGYKLGIITNGKRALQQGKLDLLGIESYFDTVVISGDYAALRCGDEGNQSFYKPNPDLFRYTAELLGERPEDLYFVGDNAENDVVGSRNAGFVPIWVKSRSPWALSMEDFPEIVVQDISELRKFL